MQWNGEGLSDLFLSNDVWERGTFLIKRHLLPAAFFARDPLCLSPARAHLCKQVDHISA